MSRVRVIARRELASLFGEPTGWLLLAALGLVQALHGLAFAIDEPRTAEAALGIYFHHAGYGMEAGALMLALARAVRDAPAERLWQSAPIRAWQVVGGRFVAGAAWVTLAAASSLALPLLVRAGEAASVGHVVVGGLGLWCVGLLALAVGLAATGLGARPATGALAAAALLGMAELAPLVASPAPETLRALLVGGAPVWSHLSSLRRGILDGADLLFFAGFTLTALVLASLAHEERRWTG